MRKMLMLLCAALSIYGAENVTTIANATPIRFYLRNYTYDTMAAKLPTLSFGLSTDVNRLVYKNASGTMYKIMTDASTSSNHAPGRVLFTDANGAANSADSFTYASGKLFVKDSVVSRASRIGTNTSNVRIDSNGVQLYGSAKSYYDITMPLATAKLLGYYDPEFTKISDNGSGSRGVYAYSFSATQLNEAFSSSKLPEAYADSTDLYVVLNFYPSTSNTGGVVFEVETAINNEDSTLGNTTVSQFTYNISTGVTKKHISTPIGTISNGYRRGAGISMRIARRGDLSGDTYPDPIWITRAVVRVTRARL